LAGILGTIFGTIICLVGRVIEGFDHVQPIDYLNQVSFDDGSCLSAPKPGETKNAR